MVMLEIYGRNKTSSISITELRLKNADTVTHVELIST